jgi:hypothetical protein
MMIVVGNPVCLLARGVSENVRLCSGLEQNRSRAELDLPAADSKGRLGSPEPEKRVVQKGTSRNNPAKIAANKR